MSVSIQDIKACLKEFKEDEISFLFRELLGWDQQPEAPRPITYKELRYNFKQVADKRGFKIYVHTCASQIPPMSVLKQLDALLADVAAAHLTIFIDAQHENQLWLWIKRQGNHATPYPTFLNKRQSGELLAQKVRSLYIDLDEELKKGINLIDVIDRVIQGFDVERVTRAFYDGSKKEEGFKDQHKKFLNHIQNITDEADRKWYTSIMLNRLMFVYFIQRKGLLDYTDPNSFNGKDHYLQDHLVAIQQQPESTYAYYREFLLPLFRCLNERERTSAQRQQFGNIPYLNGGIFDVHPLEDKYRTIKISNAAFDDLFTFFTKFTWHLDDRPSRSDKEINPDVLGYIFEKYINQKEMGAYYTKEDITGYISKNTIIPYIFEKVAQQHQDAFVTDGPIWSQLRQLPDRYIYEAMAHGVLTELPDNIKAGINDVSQRGEWNQPADEQFALDTETWREVVTRRLRYHEIRDLMENGKINFINDLITYNLDILQFATDVIDNCPDASLLRSFYDALTHVTILDPTCGSGAFLFAALNVLRPLYQACLDRMGELVKQHESHEIKLVVDHLKIFQDELNRIGKHQGQQYFILKSIMVHNLYGVDIMEEAIEICRLRFFLNLVAQLESPKDLEPLPDIDFNVLAGNTLIGFTSLDEVRRVTQQLFPAENTEEVLARIEQKAKDAERAEQAFRDCQTRGIDVDASAKQALRALLNDLRDDLNPYLATEYHIGDGTRSEENTQSAAYQAWLKDYQPFHWWVEFHKIMYDGGFDVIIGNPPYVEYKNVKDKYTIKDFITEKCGDLYAFVMERMRNINHGRCNIGLIIPVSIVSTDGFTPLREFLVKKNSITWILNFAERPSKLFVGVEKRLTIWLSRYGVETSKTFLAKYRRWVAEERDFIFSNISFVENFLETKIVRTSIPKISSQIEMSILQKISKNPPLGIYFQKNSRHVIYYTRKLRYFVQFFDFVPTITNSKGEIIEPSELKELFLATEDQKNMVISVLNSNLFFWFFNVYSDMRNVNRREIEMFRFNVNAVEDTIVQRLLYLEEMLQEDFRNNSKLLTNNYGKFGVLTIQSFQPRLSKAIIDEIDRVLAQHYGFTPEELDFIINYDIKYRMGRDNGEESE
jgi:hypothetical protein